MMHKENLNGEYPKFCVLHKSWIGNMERPWKAPDMG